MRCLRFKLLLPAAAGMALFGFELTVVERTASAHGPSWLHTVVAQTSSKRDVDRDGKRSSRRSRKKKRRRKARRRAASKSLVPESAVISQAELAPIVQSERNKRILEGRKKSRVTEGTSSRWSNRGAMVPIVSEVPITQPLPERAVPRPVGVETLGQRLQGREERISARVSIGYYHLETIGQAIDGDASDPAVSGNDSDAITNSLDLLRARTFLSYQQISNSDFGLQVDAEFRPQLAGAVTNRPTDLRVNELYLSWGRTDWRRRRTGRSWGIALGRVAIREAGFAQADGAAARFRIFPQLMVGAWGGVTGNPYGYNWLQQQAQFVSADWITGGGFASLLFDNFSLNIAGGATLANTQNALGTDRIYVYVDGSYTPVRGLNIILNGWLDMLPDGEFVQNIDLITSYSPTRKLSLSVAGGRFSTVVYSDTIAGSFVVDPNGNQVGVGDAPNRIIDGTIPFNAALLTAVYNSVRVRAGYRFIPAIEAFVRWNTLIRDTSVTNMALAEGAPGAQVNFGSLRSLPTAGLIYRNAKLFDANTSFTYVFDNRATANMIVRGGLSRMWQGLYASADIRAFFGNIDGFDGGVELSYTLPRAFTPGAFTLRGSFRYFRENVALIVPNAADVGPSPDLQGRLVPNQETLFGYAGVEWRY